MRLNICIATADDVDELAELFVDSVRSAGPRGYTPRQVDSWAASASDRERFQEFILKPTTYIAIDESGPVGFCGIEANGHIASLYLRGDRQRQGIGTQLLTHAVNQAAHRGWRTVTAGPLPKDNAGIMLLRSMGGTAAQTYQILAADF